MKMTGIIKDALLFPSKNTGRFGIYLLLSVLMVGFAIGGFFTNALGVIDGENYLLGGMYLIISLMIGFLIAGYHIKVIKSGIEHDEEVPVFELYKDFMTGFDNTVVLLFYSIIPALIVLLVALDTNLFANAIAVIQEVIYQTFNVYFMGSSTYLAATAITYAFEKFVGSLAITVTVAVILFAIFFVIESMAEARLANTGSLKEALNIFEAIKDIARIGVGRVILLILVLFLVIAIIDIIFIAVLSYFPFLLAVIYIVITPYLALFTQRALGLLYSEIT